MRDRYDPDNKIPFLITENGYGSDGSEDTHDNVRISYLRVSTAELMLVDAMG